MALSKSALAVVLGAVSSGGVAAFAPPTAAGQKRCLSAPLRGYLDDLTADLNAPDSNPIPEEESREATNMAKDQIDRFGPGNFADFVDFDEFDGGDGQMGVAGDGNSKLEKMDSVPTLNSKVMSAKNAWGTSTGYAEDLLKTNPKIDVARAQQLENWQNQREVRAKTQQMDDMANSFDNEQTSVDENWRQLAKFGVERNQDFDIDESFGAVESAAQIEGVIELKTVVNRVSVHDLSLRNPFMGFADFRAAFTPDTPGDWTIEPSEGSIAQKDDTNFVVKFRPTGPGLSQGYLVIETEDFKKTWQVMGST